MNTGKKRAGMILLSASLVLTSLAGCSKSEESSFDADAAVMTVNEETVSAGLVSFAVHYSQAQTQEMYEYYFGDNPYSYEYSDDYTIGDMVIEGCISTLQEMVLARQHMDEYEVSLTEDEETAISEAAAAFIETNDEETLEAMSATQEIVEEYLELITIQTKMEVVMCADVDTEVSDEEAAQRRIEYVYVAMETEGETEEETDTEEAESESAAEDESADETEAENAETEEETAADTEEETAAETVADEESETALLTGNTASKTTSSDETEAADTDAADEEASEAEEDTEEASEAASEAEDASEAETETETETEDPEVVAAMAEAYEKAEQILALIQEEGLDLADAAAQIDEDLTSNEITFGADSTSVVEGLITATEGLEDDTLVEYPVEASSGYYVVRLVSAFDEEATEEEKENIIEERKDEAIDTLYDEWAEDSDISEDEDVIATITFDYNLELYEEETETETEAESETGSEDESETEAESESGAEDETEAESESETEAETEAELDAEETESETEEE